MKIVIDTNVVISGTFFGGYPQRVLRSVVDGRITASATTEIITAKDFCERYLQG